MKLKNVLFAVALSALVAVPLCGADVAGTAAPEVADTKAGVPAEIATQIASVVVFPSGARITRAAPVTLRAGEQELVFSGVPKNLQADSLTAETQIPGVRITSVSSNVDYLNVRDEAAVSAANEKLKRAVAHVCDLEKQADYIRGQQNKLKAFTPQNKPADQKPEFYVKNALETLHFLEKESARLSKELLKINAEREQAQLDLDIAASEYQKVSAYSQKATRTVIVKIIADAPATGTLALNYMVSDAQWRPSYDLRVDPATKAATLVSYGVVSQRTGEDWSNVPVSLSTARPNVSADLPEFKKIVVTERYAPAPVVAKSSGFGGGSGGSIGQGMGPGIGQAESSVKMRYSSSASGRHPVAVPGPKPKEKPPSQLVISNSDANFVQLADGNVIANAQDIRFRNGNYVFKNADGVLEKVEAGKVAQISQNYTEADRGDIQVSRLRNPAQDLRGLDFRYDLARKETIKSTGTPHRYLLSSEKFAGDFYYRVVPSVNSHAYQMLAVTNANFRPILAGPANIFYGADFIGDMDVPYTLRDGKVTIPLGIDPRVFVERQKLNNIETVGVLTSSRRNTVEVKTKIINRTPEKIRVVCDESVPLSRSEEVEVSAPTFSPKATSFNKEDGHVCWNETLVPAQEIELNATYKIDYPENFALEENKL